MNTTLLLISKDPFQEWKTTPRLITAAQRYDYDIAVWLDETGTDPDSDRTRLEQMGVTPHTFTGKGYPYSCFNAAIAAMRTKWVLTVADDEMPSEALWRFDPPARYAYRVRLVSVLPDGRYYPPDQHHERLFPVEGTYLDLDMFECGPRQSVPYYTALGLVIWHYCTHAPREEREKKVRDYLAMERATNRAGRDWYPGVTRRLYLWEDYPSHPMPPDLARHMEAQ